MRAVLALVALATAQPAGAQAGEITTEVLTDLAFPTLFWGESWAIEPSHGGAASFRVGQAPGAGDALVRVTFSLPATLQTAGGDPLSVSFGPSSAAWADQDGGAATTFDPRQGLTLSVPPDGDFYVWLGGTATAAPAQPSGSYAGTVTLSVTDL